MKAKFEILDLVQGVHPILMAKINGKTCRLLIDTGASRTVFDKKQIIKFIKKSKLIKEKGIAFAMAGYAMEMYSIKLNLKIGKLSIENYSSAVVDLDSFNYACKPHLP